jgi:hypothetical protein
MKRIIEYDMDGTSVYVEVEESETEGMKRVSRGKDGEIKPIEKTDKKFSEVVSRIKPVAEAVFQSLRGMESPEEIGLEFGIKLNATAGVVFAAGGTEATFKVSLKWNNKNK